MKKCTVTLAVLALLLSSAALAPEDSMRAFAYEQSAAKSPDAKGKRGAQFAECDTDKDGMLSKSEFGVCYPRGAKKFDDMDANKDGKVSKEEIKAFRETMKKEREAKFDACDKDKDNALNAQEFAACYPRLAKRFDAIDANKDGKVTKEEMKAAAQKAREGKRHKATGM